jgi:hypothetical protein
MFGDSYHVLKEHVTTIYREHLVFPEDEGNKFLENVDITLPE